MEKLFYLDVNTTERPNNDHFMLHVHDNYEIFMFIEGDAKYVVEENVHNLEPFDVIIIRKNQLHRIYHNSTKKYKRMIINISPRFFEENNCPEYERQFNSPPLISMGNKISGKAVKSSGLYDAFMRLLKYRDESEDDESPVVKASITEILYIINNIKYDYESSTDNPQLKEVIEYINENFTGDVSLSELEKRFFISKYHLCRIFQKATGLTVHQYITKKRLAFSNEMMKSGKNINDVAESAGFNNYSSFYRAYVNEFGKKPKDEKKRLH